MKEKKLFKSNPDGSNSYYFDINFFIMIILLK
jgi:hypothetical protein